MKKEKYSVYLTDETIEIADNFYRLEGCPTRSVYIERAIQYYTAHIANGICDEYLSDAIRQTISREFSAFERHINKMLFKVCVEMDMMLNVIAASFNADSEKLGRLRVQCIEAVKRNQGHITFDQANKYQHSDEN